MIRAVPPLAADFVAEHEGYRDKAYQCSAGVWTLGYGHTLAITQGASCTRSQANMWLMEDLAVAATRLAGVVREPVLLKLTDHQYAALLSFVFNCGAPANATLWKVLNAGQFERVPAELEKWVYAGGRIVPGLVNRRAAEAALWATPEAAQPAPPPTYAPSSAATRDAVQPIPVSANRGLLSRLWSRLA